MKTIAFYDAKPYDRQYFNAANDDRFHFRFFESKLNADTVALADGADAVCAFVNDDISEKVLDKLVDLGIHIVAMRCAGYNNVDIKSAYRRVHVVHVPAYSPYAVAEHTIGLLLALNRKLHRAYNRTREHNFSLDGLIGMDLYGKTIGIIGTGRIGRVFANICKGFGMRVVAYDPYPTPDANFEYVSVDELCRISDVISLHCPLTKDTYHIINEESIAKMKHGVYLINTSRGSLIDSQALMAGLKSGKIGGAGLDVYEEESDFFYEDFSNRVLQDDRLAALISMPNVILTSHQAFFTKEAMNAIATTTLNNLCQYFNGEPLPNEICYRCTNSTCNKTKNMRCF
jgi:D-lactate dehydrogenase